MSTAVTRAEPRRRAGSAAETAGRGLRALAWALPAIALAAAGGVLANSEPELALSLALASLASVAIAISPLYALLAILAARATFADSVFLDAATAVGGIGALLLAAPRLPLRPVTIPLIGLLLFALPSVPLAPSLDEGIVPDALYVPGLGLSYAPYPSLELLEWLRLAAVLAVGGLAAWAVRDRRSLQILVAVIVASSVVPAVIALNQLATGETFVRLGTDFEAVRGPFTHPNYLAFYLVVVLTVGAVAILELRSRLVRIATAVPLALATACLVLTYTRAAWIGFAAVLLLLAVLRERRILAAAALLLVIGSVAFPGTTADVEERFSDLNTPSQTTGSENDNSWPWRTGQWRRMVPRGLERPLTGEGFGSYSRVTIEEFGSRDLRYSTVLDPTDPIGSPRGFSAHNDYVKMFVELGFPGLVLWVAVLGGMITAMLAARRVPAVRGYAEGGLALALALIVMAASDNIQGYTAVLIYSVALIGGIAGAARGISASRRNGEEQAPAGGSREKPRGAARATAPRTG